MPRQLSVPLEQLVELRKQGKSQEEIAAAVGLSRSTVGEHLRKATGKGRDRSRGKRKGKRSAGKGRTIAQEVGMIEPVKAVGLSGFRELHNYECQQERRHGRVMALIDKCIDTYLRRSAFLEAGGSEDDPKCPRGWFYDNEGPKLAHVSMSDWGAHRDEYTSIQLSVSTDGTKSGEKIAWVDPDNVELYRKAIEE